MGKLNLEEVDLYGLLGLKVNANTNDVSVTESLQLI